MSPVSSVVNILLRAAFAVGMAMLLMVSAVLGTEITSPAADSEGQPPAFGTQVAPILRKNCLACHSAAAKMGGLVMQSYDSLMKGGAHGPVILPGKANESRLIEMLEGKIQPRMPFNSDPLPAADIATISAWIDAGAPAPAPNTVGAHRDANLQPTPIPDIKPQVPVVSPVSSVRFSPDGKLLAIGSYRKVQLIDPVNKRDFPGNAGSAPASAPAEHVIATLSGHADYVRSLAFSPDGKLLAAAGGPCQQSGEIRIWDVASHALVRTLKGHKDCVYSVAWSPDGRLLASGSYDKSIKLWDAASGGELKTLQDHIDAVFAVAFSPDGKRLASASQDRTVKIWDVATGQRLYTLSDASDGLNSLAYSPSGDEIAAAGYDKTIYVWRLGENDGHLVQSLIADEDSILALVWSPDGKTIITSSADGSIRFRDAATLNPIRVIDHQPDWVQTLGMSPDGRLLAAGRYDGSLSVYSALVAGELNTAAVQKSGVKSESK
ncbi:MAG TPA: c-type cytochrome domain-containing protein [Terriglobia bacterium]|nr:c-type cytochrome domain-containing protein [Terriglobia bacterium]